MPTLKNLLSLLLGRGALLVVTLVAPASAETIYLSNTGVVHADGERVSQLYLLEIDEETGVAEAQLVETFDFDQADGLACSPDDSLCYLVDKYDAVTAPDGGALGAYDPLAGTFEIIGDLVDSSGDLLDQVILASFSPGPEGQLHVASQTNDTIYTVDTESAVATSLGQVTVAGTESVIDLDGADMVFTADGRMFLWTNADHPPDAPRGLYVIAAPVSRVVTDLTATYLGVGLDGIDPESHRFTGLAVRDNGLGNVVGSNRFDELHEQDASGLDVAVYPMQLDGAPLGHGSGDMHHSFDCFLALEVLDGAVAVGETLRVDARIVHNRPRDGVAAPVLWIEDASGLIVRSKTFSQRTFRWGDDFRRTFELDLPEWLAPGEYTVHMGIGEMRQGEATVSAVFEVIG